MNAKVRFKLKPKAREVAPEPELVREQELTPMAYSPPVDYSREYNGDKFLGGFGATQLLNLDYWTLRERSSQLFRENLYARGLIRRLITNEVNTGLTPECMPDEEIAGLAPDSLEKWTEDVENRFGLWGKNPSLCDYRLQDTFGAIQRKVRMEAYIEGDVLVILRPSRLTKAPMVQLVSGSKVMTPMGGTVAEGHKVEHGVELDPRGRQVAYWVTQEDGTSKRVPAWGRNTGRRVAWLEYGVDKRMNDVRGEPLLSIILQSLKEIDRYRDSTQRKAVINSLLAMFIKKGENKMGTLPMTGGAARNTQVSVADDKVPDRKLKISEFVPGMILEELQHGEEPVLKGGEGTDVNFGGFEEVIIQAVAWANEIPPEILKLAFSNNYSASQAAINEFKIYLNKIWTSFGETFCTPIYIDWLIGETLIGRVRAPKLLESWKNPAMHDVFGALTAVEWYGSIKPSTDMLKAAKGSALLVSEGWSNNAREARGLTGTKFSKNIKRIEKENELKVKAARPLAEFKVEFGVAPEDVSTDDAGEQALNDAIVAILEDRGLEE